MEATILPTQKNGNLKVAKQSDKILDSDVLKTVASTMIGKVIAKTADYDPEARMRDMVHTWPVSTLVGPGGYTEDGWFNAVSSQLDAMKATVTNQQPNGRWEPCAYEVDIRTFNVGGSARTMFFMGTRWVDLDNEEDTVYRNGAPADININVTAKSDKDSSGLKDVLATLAANQSSLQDLLGKVLLTKTAVTEEKTPPKKRSIKRPQQKNQD